MNVCARCGSTPTRLYIQGSLCSRCAPGPLPEPTVVTGPALRPSGHGAGLDGPACPERADRTQTPDTLPMRIRMCVRCGRITALIDGDGLAWCGGVLPEVAGKPALALVGAA